MNGYQTLLITLVTRDLAQTRDAAQRGPLSPRADLQREVVRELYEAGMSYAAIGREIGLSRERVRQLYAQVLRLRRHEGDVPVTWEPSEEP